MLPTRGWPFNKQAGDYITMKEVPTGVETTKDIHERRSLDNAANWQLKEGELMPEDVKSLGRLVYQAMFTNVSEYDLEQIRYPNGVIARDPYE